MKYKQVLMLYHVKEREYIINKMMADCMRNAGLAEDIIIGEAYCTIQSIFEYHPDLIITFFPRDERAAQLLTFIKYVYNCVIVVIPNEQYVNLTEEIMPVLFGFNKIPKQLIDYCLFWGPGLAEYGGGFLCNEGKICNKERIKVFGYLPYEKDLIRDYHVETDCTKLIKKCQKEYSKTVLIVTAVMLRDWSLNDFDEQSAYDKSNQANIEKVKASILSMNYYTNRYIEMIDYIASNNKDVLFLIKMHPVDVNRMNEEKCANRFERFAKYSNVILIDEPYQISQYMRNVDLFIHYGSTSSMEAYVNRIPSLFLTNDCKIKSTSTYGLTEYNGGDLAIPVSDKDKILKAIEIVPSLDNDSIVAKNAKTITNFNINEEYYPSKKYIEIMSQLESPQRISIRDSIVKEQLKGNILKWELLHYYSEAVKAFVRLDFRRFEKIKKFLQVFFLKKFKNE